MTWDDQPFHGILRHFDIFFYDIDGPFSSVIYNRNNDWLVVWNLLFVSIYWE
jgi:hypothetical protein